MNKFLPTLKFSASEACGHLGSCFAPYAFMNLNNHTTALFWFNERILFASVPVSHILTLINFI